MDDTGLAALVLGLRDQVRQQAALIAELQALLAAQEQRVVGPLTALAAHVRTCQALTEVERAGLLEAAPGALGGRLARPVDRMAGWARDAATAAAAGPYRTLVVEPDEEPTGPLFVDQGLISVEPRATATVLLEELAALSYYANLRDWQQATVVAMHARLEWLWRLGFPSFVIVPQ